MWAPRISSGGGIRQLPWVSRRDNAGKQNSASADRPTLARTQLDAALVCKAKLEDPFAPGPQVFTTTVPLNLLVAEREEAKAVLSLYLKKQGSSSAVASRAINRSDQFIDHLISKLHSMHKSRYQVGRELTTLEIRNALVPYLESLREKHGNQLIEVVESFPDPPSRARPAGPPPAQPTDPFSKKHRAVARATVPDPGGALPDHVLYLLDLGMDLAQIEHITRRFPAFAYYNLERKIKPLVDLLLHLGVPRADIPTIIYKRPQLCGISLADNLLPTMAHLEAHGIDGSQWAKIIYRFPALLTYSRHKILALVDYLSEIGVPPAAIGKILTRCPHIISYSVDDKLRPTAKYLNSIGIDVASLVSRCPQTFGLSVEASLKPIAAFFLERGFSQEELAVMVAKYGALYTFSLRGNLGPKWEFFLSTGYPREELVKFPHYFGYSLEARIKPRYATMAQAGVRLVLNQLLSVSDAEFEKVLARKMKLADGGL
ncbi:mitochondrial transcription termination factor family protein isoform X2 [Wolffia australiana]